MAVAYDAIHHTQFAYVTAAYSPHRCDHGYTTITGWSPDQTRALTDPREPPNRILIGAMTSSCWNHTGCDLSPLGLRMRPHRGY